MSVRIVERAVLDAPPERVWAVLADWEGQAAWMPDVVWIRVVSKERGLGARLRVRTRVFGIPATTDLLMVTAWEPHRRLRVRHSGMVKGWGEWLLEPVGGATRLTWVEVLELPPARLGDLAFRAYEPIQRWMLRRSIRNLARILRTG